jgi:murein L,D-transpeptidase YcbB/YkuD
MRKLCTCFLPLLLLVWRPETPALQRPALVDRFYQQRHQQLFWFAPGNAAVQGRKQLLDYIDSAAWLGLDSNRYHPADLRQLESVWASEQGNVSFDRMGYDRQYTDAALALAIDVFRGVGTENTLEYDGVSPRYKDSNDTRILSALVGAAMPDHILQCLDSLQPVSAEYRTLRTALRQRIDSGDRPRVKSLSAALNACRWVHHFSFARFIVVNIPSATLRYYADDTLSLRMRIVAGQPSKRTPRFAAWVDGLVLYPYWNIPRRIATHEMLPLFKKAPQLATIMEIQVLDRKGRIIDPGKVDWQAYGINDFPYTLRQAPGCENALGVLKFDISSPFSVYMHDTNVKRAFGSSWRYLSHGCIRLEKPALLGEILMDHRLDTAILNACLRDQQPVPIPLHPPVAVFVLYNTVEPGADGSVAWFKDVYHLLP